MLHQISYWGCEADLDERHSLVGPARVTAGPEDPGPLRIKEVHMAVGALRSIVLDVNDLGEAERFWSSVLGLEVQWPAGEGQFSRIGAKGAGSVLLQLVPEKKTDLKNRAHIDVTVMAVGRAVEEVVKLGGSVIKEPGLWPDVDPVLEWAVMADPSGNEFCLIRELRPTL
jgi:predicted enzyme related to lactoylglutathione lyase